MLGEPLSRKLVIIFVLLLLGNSTIFLSSMETYTAPQNSTGLYQTSMNTSLIILPLQIWMYNTPLPTSNVPDWIFRRHPFTLYSPQLHIENVSVMGNHILIDTFWSKNPQDNTIVSYVLPAHGNLPQIVKLPDDQMFQGRMSTTGDLNYLSSSLTNLSETKFYQSNIQQQNFTYQTMNFKSNINGSTNIVYLNKTLSILNSGNVLCLVSTQLQYFVVKKCISNLDINSKNLNNYSFVGSDNLVSFSQNGISTIYSFEDEKYNMTLVWPKQMGWTSFAILNKTHALSTHIVIFKQWQFTQYSYLYLNTFNFKEFIVSSSQHEVDKNSSCQGLIIKRFKNLSKTGQQSYLTEQGRICTILINSTSFYTGKHLTMANNTKLIRLSAYQEYADQMLHILDSNQTFCELNIQKMECKPETIIHNIIFAKGWNHFCTYILWLDIKSDTVYLRRISNVSQAKVMLELNWTSYSQLKTYKIQFIPGASSPVLEIYSRTLVLTVLCKDINISSSSGLQIVSYTKQNPSKYYEYYQGFRRPLFYNYTESGSEQEQVYINYGFYWGVEFAFKFNMKKEGQFGLYKEEGSEDGGVIVKIENGIVSQYYFKGGNLSDAKNQMIMGEVVGIKGLIFFNQSFPYVFISSNGKQTIVNTSRNIQFQSQKISQSVNIVNKDNNKRQSSRKYHKNDDINSNDIIKTKFYRNQDMEMVLLFGKQYHTLGVVKIFTNGTFEMAQYQGFQRGFIFGNFISQSNFIINSFDGGFYHQYQMPFVSIIKVPKSVKEPIKYNQWTQKLPKTKNQSILDKISSQDKLLIKLTSKTMLRAPLFYDDTECKKKNIVASAQAVGQPIYACYLQSKKLLVVKNTMTPSKILRDEIVISNLTSTSLFFMSFQGKMIGLYSQNKIQIRLSLDLKNIMRSKQGIQGIRYISFINSSYLLYQNQENAINILKFQNQSQIVAVNISKNISLATRLKRSFFGVEHIFLVQQTSDKVLVSIFDLNLESIQTIKIPVNGQSIQSYQFTQIKQILKITFKKQLKFSIVTLSSLKSCAIDQKIDQQGHCKCLPQFIFDKQCKCEDGFVRSQLKCIPVCPFYCNECSQDGICTNYIGIIISSILAFAILCGTIVALCKCAIKRRQKKIRQMQESSLIEGIGSVDQPE